MRRYGEAIEVRRGRVGESDGPVMFLWRGRVFRVRDIVGHWLEAGAWWETAAATGLDGAGLVAGEREIWRVEARSARGARGVFDLCFEWASGSWRLLAVHD